MAVSNLTLAIGEWESKQSENAKEQSIFEISINGVVVYQSENSPALLNKLIDNFSKMFVEGLDRPVNWQTILMAIFLSISALRFCDVFEDSFSLPLLSARVSWRSSRRRKFDQDIQLAIAETLSSAVVKSWVCFSPFGSSKVQSASGEIYRSAVAGRISRSSTAFATRLNARCRRCVTFSKSQVQYFRLLDILDCIFPDR